MESTRQPKEYGLLFIAAMARAAVAGIKTQTRRLPTASNSLVDGVGISAKRWADMQFDWSRAVVDKGPSPAGNPGPYLHVPAGNGETWHRIYPRYQVGDRIWGRETWAPCGRNSAGVGPDFLYRADLTKGSYYPAVNRWTPSIHMPRIAARIVRDIVGVRVERLQDISEADALAEGIAQVVRDKLPVQQCGEYDGIDVDPVDLYRDIWESINGPGSWDANPPVIVIEFAGVQS